MRGNFAQMNTCSAAECSGSFAASMASFLLMIAGIALAVSVLFVAALAVRLCLAVLVCLAISIIAIILPVALVGGPTQTRE